MKRIIRLTENDLANIVKRVIRENEDSIEIELDTDYTNPDDKIIKSDLKREKSDESLIRRTMSAEEREVWIEKCISDQSYRGDQKRVEYECRYANKVGTETWADVAFGYKMDTSKAPVSNKVNKIVIANKTYDLPEQDPNDNIIVYYCPESGGYLDYKNKKEPNMEQQERDEIWLGRFCDSINWTSRVGKKRNIFRNPKL